ncbi:MAG: VCBS repeat-containing protein [Cytophagales bacterium]|nr:VCBS repeat-containing protein [Cytophagales bacterium]
MKKNAYLSVLASLLLFLIKGCNSTVESHLFIQKKPSETGLLFQNNLDEEADFNILNYLYYYNGGGVGIGDFNNDGLQDIYFTANLEGNKLYLNQGTLRFEDITEEAGVKGRADWSTGVSIADVNADGWLDIYICGLGDFEGKKGTNELYINNGPSPATGQLTFTESAREYGLDVSSLSTQAAFFDYDHDGDLDMYLLNHAIHSTDAYAPRSAMLTRTEAAVGDKLFKNELDKGQKHFVEVTSTSGILRTPIGFGLGIGCADIDQDGWTDIYVSNDFHENDYLLINQKDGTFSEELSKWVGHTSKYSMGNDIADYNNDGLPDIMTLDMLPYQPEILQKSMAEDHYDLREIILKNGYHRQLSRNCLQLNRGDGFAEIASFAGVEASDWSWAPLWADLDNDGLKDLYITNGIFRRPNDLDYLNYTSQKAIKLVMGSKTASISRKLIEAMPQNPIANMAFKNSGKLTFTNETMSWGLDVPSHSNGAAYADLDNDGDLELILNNINEPALLFENKANDRPDRGTYLQIRFEGNNLNTTGIGAKAIIKHQGNTYYQEQMPVRGFISSMSHMVHFGLGKLTSIDSLWIVWPGGAYQLFENVPTNQMMKIKQSDASGHYYETITYKSKENALFEKIIGEMFDYKHQENAFHDVYREYLVPRLLSTEGPGMAVGDINNDGLDDVFFTNAQRKAAKMFTQLPDGEFVAVNQTLFEEDRIYEGVAAEFFDVDNDGDLDLFVGSAGNDYKDGEAPLQDRLYMNDGVGNFTKARNAIPDLFFNTACVAPKDYDKDGDIDLFIGSRAIAGSYGISPESYLLQNDGYGKFTTAGIPRELSKAGMITDAVWADVDNNGWDDLIVVGEWMSIMICLNNEGVLSPSSGHFAEKSEGWWNCVIADDFDNDGDMDLVAGNVGLNTKPEASADRPVRLYVKDFDDNGSTDPVMTCYMQGKEYPFATKDVLSRQLVFLKKKFTTYSAFAGTTLGQLFTPEQLEGAIVKEAVEFRSMYFENKGEGKFRAVPLPLEANFSPIMSMVSRDINGDGLKDLITGGNFYGFTPGMSVQDAGHGLLLINKGGNGFEPLDHHRSGIMMEGQIRAMHWITLVNGSTALLAARNNESVILLNMRKEGALFE